MNLVEALDLTAPAYVAIVGGGGKTTTLFELGHQLPGKVWLSTTTHLGTDQLDRADRHFIVNEVNDAAVTLWLEQKSTLLTGDFTPDNRVHGPKETDLANIYQIARQNKISLVVEADGSRSRPVKAPGENEPATPAWAEMVITIVGLSVLGKPFDDQTVHRVEPYAHITGSQVGDAITLESLTKLLVHPQGGLKNCPPGAVRVALLNQADNIQMRDEAANYAPRLLAGGYDRVLIGSFQFAPDQWLRFK